MKKKYSVINTKIYHICYKRARGVINSNIKRIIIFSIVIGFILNLFLADYSNPRRTFFFRYHSKLCVAYIFGYLPKEYSINYSEIIIEETNDYCLINVTYNKFPTENHNYIILREKGKHVSEEILLDSDSLFGQIKGISNLLSSQIELSVFRKYLNYKDVYKKKKIIESFCQIMSDFGNSDYKILHNASEIYELNKVTVFKDSVEDCYKILKKGFIPDFKNKTYCWFEGMGLFEMSFIFKGGQLVSLNDEFIFGELALSLGTNKCSAGARL